MMLTHAWFVMLFTISLAVAPPSASELAKQIQRAASAREPAFRVPTAEFDFGKSSLVLSGAESFELDGQGSTLWFACGFGVQLIDSTTVHAHNFTIDYDPPCFAQGVITAIEPVAAKTIHATFDPHFARPEIGLLPGSEIPNNNVKIAYWSSDSMLMLRNYSQPSPNAVNNFLVKGTLLEETDDGLKYSLDLKAPINLKHTPGVALGSLITIHSRTDGGVYNGAGQAYLVLNSTNVLSEDIDIFGGGAMGLVEALGIGQHSYRRMRVTRRNRRGSNTLRLLSTNVDAMHSGQLKHGPLIEDSELAYCGDDFGNIHTRMELVLNRLSDHSLLILDTEDGHTFSYADVVGATLTFRHLNSFEFLGSSVVEAVEDIGLPEGWDDPAAYSVNLTAVLNAAPYNANVRPDTILPRAYIVHFAEKVPLDVEGMWSLAESDSRKNIGSIVRRNYFHDGYARVFLMKSSGGMLVDNRFEHAGGVMVEAGGLGSQHWLEGPMTINNILVANNTIEGCGGQQWLVNGEGATNVTVHNNTVLDAEVRLPLSDVVV